MKSKLLFTGDFYIVIIQNRLLTFSISQSFKKLFDLDIGSLLFLSEDRYQGTDATVTGNLTKCGEGSAEVVNRTDIIYSAVHDDVKHFNGLIVSGGLILKSGYGE